jgi:hypothetical protein
MQAALFHSSGCDCSSSSSCQHLCETRCSCTSSCKHRPAAVAMAVPAATLVTLPARQAALCSRSLTTSKTFCNHPAGPTSSLQASKRQCCAQQMLLCAFNH